MLSFIANLGEIVNVVTEEKESYTFSEFLSDTGGAAGLFLGINILGTRSKSLKISKPTLSISDLLRQISSFGSRAMKISSNRRTSASHQMSETL